MTSRRRSPSSILVAIASFLGVLAACTLQGLGRDRCPHGNSDCNAPRVCYQGTCVDNVPTGGTSGQDGAPPDGASADGGVCSPSIAFDPPSLVAGLNDQAPGVLARFSDDELTVYFNRLSGGYLDTYTATRADRSLPFEPAIPILVTSNRDETCPFVTDGGLKLYTASRAGGITGNWALYTATRTSTAVQFSSLTDIASLNVAQDGCLYIAAGYLLFTSERAGNVNIYSAKFAGGGFGPAEPLSVNTAGADEFTPVLSPDGLVLYYASAPVPRPPTGPWGLDVMMAIRSSTDQPFGAPVPLADLNTDADEQPTWVSHDGCRLYFTRNDAVAGSASYVAGRRR